MSTATTQVTKTTTNKNQNNSIPLQDIIIREERYRKEFGDIDTLAENINNLGLLQPIVINNENNELIDGERRILAFKKLGKTEIPCFRIDLEKIVLGEFSANHYRKDWTISEKVAIKRAIEPYEKKKAKERQKKHGNTAPGKTKKDKDNAGNNNTCANLAQVKSRDIVAGFVDIGRTTLKKAEEIVKAAEQKPDKYQSLLDKIDSKKMSVNQAHNKLKKEQKREELIKFDIKSKLEIPENCKLILGDFIQQTQNEIPDSSIDLIFTDPPYGKEDLPLYEELPKLAERVLKPGGSLVFLTGHIILDEVFNIFHQFSLTSNNIGLKYWWTLAVKHSGHHKKIYPRYVFAEWKPLLWYVKGERANNLVISNTIGDFIESTPPSKLLHDWEQSTVEAEYIIKNLTLENRTVLDPMMGLGTTGIAALNLKRRFIGIELNHETFLIAKSRFANMTLTDSMSS